MLSSSIFGADALRLRYTRQDKVQGEVTGHGTAFAFAPRKLLTCAHNVLDNGQRIEVIHVEFAGDWIRAKVITLAEEADIAIIEVAQDLPFNDFGDDPHEDQGVRVSGSPKGLAIKDEAAIVKKPYAVGLRFLASITNFDHGMSGSPCLQGKKIVGMCVAGVPKDGDLDHKQCYFVPVSALKYFAEQK